MTSGCSVDCGETSPLVLELPCPLALLSGEGVGAGGPPEGCLRDGSARQPAAPSSSTPLWQRERRRDRNLARESLDSWGRAKLFVWLPRQGWAAEQKVSWEPPGRASRGHVLLLTGAVAQPKGRATLRPVCLGVPAVNTCWGSEEQQPEYCQQTGAAMEVNGRRPGQDRPCPRWGWD